MSDGLKQKNGGPSSSEVPPISELRSAISSDPPAQIKKKHHTRTSAGLMAINANPLSTAPGWRIENLRSRIEGNQNHLQSGGDWHWLLINSSHVSALRRHAMGISSATECPKPLNKLGITKCFRVGIWKFLDTF